MHAVVCAWIPAPGGSTTPLPNVRRIRPQTFHTSRRIRARKGPRSSPALCISRGLNNKIGLNAGAIAHQDRSSTENQMEFGRFGRDSTSGDPREKNVLLKPDLPRTQCFPGCAVASHHARIVSHGATTVQPDKYPTLTPPSFFFTERSHFQCPETSLTQSLAFGSSLVFGSR